MEIQYFFKGKNTPIELVFKYDVNGNLKALEVVGEPLNEKQWNWLFSPEILPSTEVHLLKLAKWPGFAQKFSIEKVPISITFEDFWATYGRIGTKSLAKKKFDKLKEGEVLQAFLGIEKEKQKKKLDGTAMPYAETYLNQKRWET